MQKENQYMYVCPIQYLVLLLTFYSSISLISRTGELLGSKVDFKVRTCTYMYVHVGVYAHENIIEPYNYNSIGCK